MDPDGIVIIKDDVQKFGTPEGLERAWDTRGRGRKEEDEATGTFKKISDEVDNETRYSKYSEKDSEFTIETDKSDLSPESYLTLLKNIPSFLRSPVAGYTFTSKLPVDSKDSIIPKTANYDPDHMWITVYTNDIGGDAYRNLLHECAHAYDADNGISDNPAWKKIISTPDEHWATEGNYNAKEEFAWSVTKFYQDPKAFHHEHAKRYNFLKSILKDTPGNIEASNSPAPEGSISRTWRDNPGGSWLAEERADDEERYQNGRRVPGTPTGGFEGHMPMEMIGKLPGLNDEHLNRQILHDFKSDPIRDSVKSEGIKEAVFINVNHRGDAFISEGNHRTALAREFGFKSIPVEVRYYGGGEDVPGPWNLKDLEAKFSTEEKKPEKASPIDTRFSDNKLISDYCNKNYSPKLFQTCTFHVSPFEDAGDFASDNQGDFDITFNKALVDEKSFEAHKKAIYDKGDEEYTVSNKYALNKGMETYRKFTIDHEVGHLKQALLERIDGDDNINNLKDQWKVICKGIVARGEIVSEYGLTNYAEEFAEMHCAYVNNITIPDEVFYYMKSVDKALEGYQ
jgi:hypothetical protein